MSQKITVQDGDLIYDIITGNITVNASLFATIFIGTFEANDANGPTILDEAASVTNPTLVPDRSDVDTGVGTEGADQLNLIAGGLSRMVMQTGGIASLRSDTDTDTEDRQLQFQHTDATIRALIGYEASGDFVIRNQVHGAPLIISAENAAGTERIILESDPDNITTLRSIAGLSLKVGAGAGEFVLNSNLNGSVDLYWDNVLKLRTANQLVVGTGAQVIDGDGVFRSVGFNVMPLLEQDIAFTFNLAKNGQLLHRDDTADIDYTCPDDSDIPIGAEYKVTNEGASGLFRILGATDVTVRHFTGAAVNSVTAGNGFTLAVGAVVTVYKYADDEFHIWGDGITTSA